MIRVNRIPLLAGDRLNVRAVAQIPLRQLRKKGGWPRRSHYEKHPERLETYVPQKIGEASEWGMALIESVLKQEPEALL